MSTEDDDEQMTGLDEGALREFATAAAEEYGLDADELLDAMLKRGLSLQTAVTLARREKGVKRIDPGDAAAASAESTRRPTKER